ncbi:MAG: tetratricopeptide repeat protein [Bacteroidota bacterium]
MAFLLYGNTLSHNFALDDMIVITGNKFTQKGIDGIPDILTQDAFVGAYGEALELTGGRYRPLSIVMFAIEYEFFGKKPFIGHLMNVLLYGLTGIMLYLLLIKLLPGQNPIIPLIASVLFIVHPVHTEVIANIKSRDEIMGLLFLLATLLTLFKSKPKYIVLSALFYFLALMSKENAITALAIIPVTLYFFTDNKIKKIFLKTLPFMAVAIIYLVLRAKYAGTLGDREATNVMDNPFLYAGFVDKYATITYIAGKYIGLLFFPHPLSCDYSFNQIPVIGWGNLKAVVPILIYAGLIIYAIRNITKKSIIVYGILFFLISYSIVSNVFFNIGTLMGERFIYLPSVGFCIALGALIVKILKVDITGDFKYKLKWVLPLLFILPVASYATITRNKVWENNFTLYETDVKTVSNSARIHLFYGLILQTKYGETKDERLLDRSINELQIACKINPEFYHAYYDLGQAYLKKDDYDAAIACFNKTLEIQPKHQESHFCLGVSYGKGKGDLDKAIYYLEKTMTFRDQRDEYYTSLGTAYAMKGDNKKALEIFNSGIKKYPNSSKLYLNLGITYDRMGDKETAQKFYDKAFVLDPSLKIKP